MTQTMRSPNRTERLEARVTRSQKDRIEHAARLRGTTVTEFVISEMQMAAEKTIAEFEIMSLRDQERELFVNALLNPPEPSESLKTAARRYKKVMGL